MGAQQSVDGGERRWRVTQEILHLLRRDIVRFGETVNSPSLVIKSSEGNERGGSWPYIRLVDDHINGQLRKMLVQSILQGEALEVSYISTFSLECLDCLKSYLLNDDSLALAERIRKSEFLYRNISEQHLKDVFILRALLSFQVIHHSLRKRWSVDYG